MISIFIEFLIEQGVLKQFLKRLVEADRKEVWALNKLLSKADPYSIVISAFVWDQPQDSINWYDIHTKWVDRVRTLRLEDKLDDYL